MANEYLKSRFSEDKLPYVMILRTINEGMGAERGEQKDVEWKCMLADDKGRLHAWVDVEHFKYQLSKGWKIIGYGNLGFIPNGGPTDHFDAVKAFVMALADASNEARSAIAELAAERSKQKPVKNEQRAA